jgi:tRNA threonylcarbamoyladenosine biosynthesis protein TsaB
MRLALDTATDRLSVALGRDPVDSAEVHVDGARRHAAAILPSLDRLLASRGVLLADVTDVVVADGPGSFTGLRVGAAVAKALAATRGVTLWAAPALAARAAAAARPGEVVASVLDALRGEVYCAAWRREAAGLVPVLAAAARAPGRLRADMPAPDVLLGEAPAPVQAALEGWAGRTVWAARADARALLAAPELAGVGIRVDDPATWEPTYGRPAEAQSRWEAEHGRALPHTPGARG